MSTNAQKGELLGELNGKTITTTIIEASLKGVTMEGNDEAHFTGRYNAREVETVRFFMKADGTYEWETKGIQTTDEGDFIVFNGRGVGKQVGANGASWEGDLVFQTRSPILAWLNDTKAFTEGNGDFSTGEFHGRIYTRK